MDDGTFSQYSIVYHRMILDLLSAVELLRNEWSLGSFSDSFYQKVNLAIEWYSSMVDPISGNAPNIGANDGTYLFNYDQKSIEISAQHSYLLHAFIRGLYLKNL